MSGNVGRVGDADQALVSDQAPAGLHPTGFDPSRGGKLGETPILWRFRMQYAWNDDLAVEHPDWDQCCTCSVFAVSETRARQLVWDKFKDPMSVTPVSIASCHAERYENDRDRELEREWSKARATDRSTPAREPA